MHYNTWQSILEDLPEATFEMVGNRFQSSHRWVPIPGFPHNERYSDATHA